MSKNEEKIIISKKLADDLLWWLEHAYVPYVTIGERWRHECNPSKKPAMEIARDSMVDELLNAIKRTEFKCEKE